MLIVKYRKIFFIISSVIIALSVGSILFFGLNFGVDFTGGALIEARYESERPSKESVENTLVNLGLDGASVRPAGETSYIVRTSILSDEQRGALPESLSINGEHAVSIERFNEIGPTIGQELRNKALIALGLVSLAIIFYIAFAFRGVSKPVSSWIYGLIAVVALLFDTLTPVGVFAVLGNFVGAQVDTLFVMALLAILGYSVNDTIVVFDRVRENLSRNKERGRKEEFALTVGKSLNQTYVRSVNTSITTLVVLLALFFLGPDTTRDFALVLMVGVIAGTYSSLALATPLLVAIERRRK
jgi:preprotein translocase subunit SecF